MESPEVLTMRAMAWQRAKGELQAMLATYQPATGSLGGGGPDQAVAVENDMKQVVQVFVQQVEKSL